MRYMQRAAVAGVVTALTLGVTSATAVGAEKPPRPAHPDGQFLPQLPDRLNLPLRQEWLPRQLIPELQQRSHRIPQYEYRLPLGGPESLWGSGTVATHLPDLRPRYLGPA